VVYRPWPSCVNPETGNQWADDMKTKVVEILANTEFQLYRLVDDTVWSLNR
jgi:hypothetical protein